MSASGGFVLTGTAQLTALLFAQGGGSLSINATGSLTGAAVTNDMVGAATFTFSAIGILTDPNAYPDRRPKSTNRLRLQRISEGRGVALSARATTRVRPVHGAGAIVSPVLVHSPGAAICLSARSRSRARASRARGGAQARPLSVCAITHTARVSAAGGSSANVLSGRAIAMAHESTGAGGARSEVGSAMAVTGHSYAHARGGKNLPDAVLAAVVRATIDTYR